MQLTNTSVLLDKRSNCYSALFEIEVGSYLDIIDRAYQDKGGLSGQRDALKSSSALRIRKRMIIDIQEGAILPPIVLGLIVDPETFENLPGLDGKKLEEIISKRGNLSIIDGMQRTTALFEAAKDHSTSQLIRVEFWISAHLNSLIYRMLILNTGQVPWNLRRQVETVFTSMIAEIVERVPEINLIKIDESSRRSRGGQFHANDVVELYLAFGGRKEKVDTKERLADEFTRLDFIEATEDADFADNFYRTLRYLTRIDVEISRLQRSNLEGASTLRFNVGKDLFSSQPARVGFTTAVAKKIMGRPGNEKSKIEKVEEQRKIFGELEDFVKRLEKLSNEEIEELLALNLLSEKLSVKSGRVGDFEREFFTKAFETLLEEGAALHSLEVCWLSY